MSLVRNTWMAITFWVVAFIAAIAGAVVGGKFGYDHAPAFEEGSGVSASSHLLSGAGGALFCGGVVVALFAGVWMALWALDRRAHPQMVEEDTFDLDEAWEFETQDEAA